MPRLLTWYFDVISPYAYLQTGDLHRLPPDTELAIRYRVSKMTVYRAMDEFARSFAGNLQGRTQTVPLAVYQQLQTDRDGAVALSLVLVVVSIAVLVALRERIMGAR